MSFLRQRPLYRWLLYVIIVIAMAGAVILLVQNRNNVAENDIPPNFLSLTTPTPYPLPTTAYDVLPVFTIAPGTILDESSQFVDPLSIETNGQKQAENEYLNLYSENDYLPIDIQWWQQESRRVYEYVSQRLDTQLSSKVIVTFVRPEQVNCPARGRTFVDKRIIQIFADEAISKEQILGVLAHELGHVLTFHKYENLNDLALSEGMATWAAGDYWTAWKGLDFNSSVRDFINKGIYLPLFENYDFQKAYDQNSTDCVTDRDILYTEMAAFIDYLIQKYGMEQLSVLFNVPQSEAIDNKNIVYPPNYKEVYGLEFNQLEYEWLKILFQPS
jgi:hypothetical protein